MMDLISDMGPIDWLGICGSLLIAGAYFCVSRAWMTPTRAPYHLVNLIGAALILFSLYFRPNAGAILIEVLWALIAISALIGLAFGRKS